MINGKTISVEEALELENLDSALEKATASAGELIRNMEVSLTSGTCCSIVVEDEFRNKLRSLNVVS